MEILVVWKMSNCDWIVFVVKSVHRLQIEELEPEKVRFQLLPENLAEGRSSSNQMPLPGNESAVFVVGEAELISEYLDKVSFRMWKFKKKGHRSWEQNEEKGTKAKLTSLRVNREDQNTGDEGKEPKMLKRGVSVWFNLNGKRG